MKTYVVLLFLLLASVSACTSSYTVKNKALVLSVEKFDNEVQSRAKATFVDQEEQKVFADFIKKNSRLDLKSFELKGENEASGELTVETFPKSLDAELKAVSGKEWAAKVKPALEKKDYPFTMKKSDKWEISGLPF